MKITLVKPPAVHYKKMFTAGQLIPPIGLAYLASHLKKHHFNVAIVDGVGLGIKNIFTIENGDYIVQGLTDDQIAEEIPSDTDIIGISCMFSSEWHYYKKVIQKIKKRFPGTLIIVGGEHATAEWKYILEIAPEVDFCVLGEGEETLVELLNSIKNGSSLSDVQGIAFRNKDQIIQTARRGRISELDQLVNPDWSLIPVDAYLEAGNSMAGLNKRALPILASRGCPYKCTFCTSPQMWGTKMYYRSPHLVVQEIKDLYQKYNVNHIDMIDIVGMFNLQWTREFLTELIDAQLPISWLHAAGTRSEIMNEEILSLLVKSKAVRIHFSPESGSEATLNRVGKRINLDKFLSTVKLACEKGLSVRSALIIGFPKQTKYEMFESLIFGFKLIWYGVDDVVIHSYSALPGSELYIDLQRSGTIDTKLLRENNEYDRFLSQEVVTRIFTSISWSEYIPSIIIPITQTTFMSLYYLFNYLVHPKKIFISFKRLKNKTPLTLAEHMIYNSFNFNRLKNKYFRDSA